MLPEAMGSYAEYIAYFLQAVSGCVPCLWREGRIFKATRMPKAKVKDGEKL